MSRLLAALKNLEGRGHFTARDEPLQPGSTDVPQVEPESPVAAGPAVTVATAGTSSESEPNADHPRRAEVEPGRSEIPTQEPPMPSPPIDTPVVHAPPVLDVGLIRGSSIPGIETVDDLLDDASDVADLPPEDSATALLDALLEEKLGPDDSWADPSPDGPWVTDRPVVSDAVPAEASDPAAYATEPDVVEPESSELGFAGEAPSSSSEPVAEAPYLPPIEFQQEQPLACETDGAGQTYDSVSEPADGNLPVPDPQLPEGLFDHWNSPAETPAESLAEPSAEPPATSWADAPSQSPTESTPQRNLAQEDTAVSDGPFSPSRVNFRSREAELRMRLLADEDDESASDESPATQPAVVPAPAVSEPSDVEGRPPAKVLPHEVVPTDTVPQQDGSVPATDAPAGVHRQPVDIEEITDIRDDSRVAEYQAVASRLWADCCEQRRKSILIVGIGEESHLTATTASIALVLAKAHGARVLLVDGDIRDRRLTEALRQTATPGLASAFDRERVLDPPAVPTTTPGLEFMPAGQPRCSIRRDDASMLAGMLRELSRRFDLVLVDGGCLPALPTEMLAHVCDVTYPVVRVGQTNLDEATALLEQIRKAGGDVPGFIAVDVPGTETSDSF